MIQAILCLGCALAARGPLSPARQGPEREAGLTLRVFQVEGELQAIPKLGPDQTPNLDVLITALDLDASRFGGLGAPVVSHVLGWLVVERAGPYRLRLTSDDGSRVTLDDRLVVDHDGRHGATSITSETLSLAAGAHTLLVEHFDSGGARALRLEWQAPGSAAFEALPPRALLTEKDLTRVTSPGPKRILDDRRPGDGRALEGVHPAWELEDFLPAGFEPKVGAMAFLPDGRLLVGTFDPLQRDDRSLPDIESKPPDHLWALEGLSSAGPVTVRDAATEFYEPAGMCVVEGALYVAHRRAIERLSDRDGDGFFETHEVVGKGWEAWNYHQFVFGLAHREGRLYAALSTTMAPPAWEGMETNAGPNGPLRGGILEVDLASGDTRVIAGGTRTPNGIGLGPEGALVYLDNQGAWMPASQLAEVIPGRFYGHYNWTNPVPLLAERFPEGGHPSIFCDRARTPAAVLMPQNEVSNSPTQPQLVTDGVFAGQLLIGELTAGGIRRVSLERVNGQLQGALFRHTQGLACGVNRMVWGPDGCLYVGGIGAGGNWNWRGTQFGLQRLRPTGRVAFEMRSVRARPGGFEIEFTKAVDPAWLEDPANYVVRQWTYEPTGAYGGPKVDPLLLQVTRASALTNQRVRLDVAGLRAGHCVHLRCDPLSLEGEPLWSTEAWYTLNQIPRQEPGAAAPSVGVGVLPPPSAVTLLGSAFPAALRYEGASGSPAPRTQAELLAAPPYAEVGGGSGNLVSTTVFGDARLHVEWYSPPGGEGQLAGNSGIYLQDRYELQVLGTPAGKEPLESNEAASLYAVKAPDHNASTGAGTWQAYDIFFHAPRFEAGKKTADARVTLYWNGVLVHDDVPVAEPTGSRREAGEDSSRAVQLGPLCLQDHASDAVGPVRYRNVWIDTLEPEHYGAGEWGDLLALEEGWVVRGGEASFTLEDGVLRGESRPRTKNTFLTSRARYDDFELVWEVRGDPELNSGMQLRSEVVGGIEEQSGALQGYQVELDPGPRAWSGGLYDESRRGWLHPLHAAPYARRAFRPGTWNRFRVVATGPVIRTWINGVPAAEVFDALSTAGHLAFQIHGVGEREDPLEITWRNVRLRPLVCD